MNLALPSLVMNQPLRHVTELLDAQQSDASEWFVKLWALTQQLRERVNERFPNLVRDPSSLAHDRYASTSADGPNGHMTTWTGDNIDWMVHSHLVNTKMGFCNMHLTLWLGPQIKVPHLAFAFGTFPDLFFLADFPTRADTIVDTEHLFKYHEELNPIWLKHRENSELRPFVSRSLYVRETLSETAWCYLADKTDENVALYSEMANQALDIWFRWIDEAVAVASEDQAVLAQRDLQVRRYAADLDPANALAVRYFGEEKVHQLERQLWGADRELRRVGGFSNECPPPAKRPSNY